MNLIRKLSLFVVALCVYTQVSAQIEVARISTKDFKATGFGGFLNFSIPVSNTWSNAAIVEGGVFVFSNNGSHEAVAPVLGGYRYLLTDADKGFYVEPVAGYTFGGTDIQEYDANGVALTKANGDQLDRKVGGLDTGLGFGYLFEQSGPIRFNISLRYEHTFVNGDPALNIISLRISHSFSF